MHEELAKEAMEGIAILQSQEQQTAFFQVVPRQILIPWWEMSVGSYCIPIVPLISQRTFP